MDPILSYPVLSYPILCAATLAQYRVDHDAGVDVERVTCDECGGKRFVDNLLAFSVQLGIDYSAAWTDASVLQITSLATHPNFLGYDEDDAVALSKARCMWVTCPTSHLPIGWLKPLAPWKRPPTAL